MVINLEKRTRLWIPCAAIGGNRMISNPVTSSVETALLKSTYYGIALGECLKNSGLGKYDVLLEPSTLKLSNGEWEFSSTPRPIDPIALVDFFAWTSPDAGMMRNSSFGNKLSPLITVRAASFLKPSTEGLVLVPKDWFYITKDSRVDALYNARNSAGASITEFLSTPAQYSSKGWVSPWASLTPSLPASLIRESTNPAYGEGTITVHPSVLIDFKQQRNTNAANEEIIDTCNVITNALYFVINNRNLDLTINGTLQSYADSISKSSNGQITVDQLMSRLDVIKKFRNTEIKFLEAQDAKWKELILTPDVLLAYKKVREQEASTANSVALKQWLSTGTMVAGVGAGYGGDIYTMQAANSLSSNFDEQATNTSITGLSIYSDVYSILNDFTTDIQIEGEELKISTYSELRRKIIDLYKSKYLK